MDACVHCCLVALGFFELCFKNLTGFDTGGTNGCAPDSAIEVDFDDLKIGKESPQGFADNFGTRAAFASYHTASLIFNAGDRPFAADFTHLCHDCYPFDLLFNEV